MSQTIESTGIVGFCGDGLTNNGEACDDGNQDNTDECLAGCVLPKCGDGFTRTNVEQCDDGNLEDTDGCLSTCLTATCGDGFVHIGVEVCDSEKKADETPAPMCIGCQYYCGDNVQQPGEECDAGTNNSAMDVMVDAADGTLDDAAWCSSQCKRRYRYVFGSSDVYPGNLNGTLGADGKCNTLAESASIVKGLKFRAWLSTQGDNASSPNNEAWKKSSVPYILPDNETVVALGYTHLTTSSLLNPINKTEKAGSLPTNCVNANKNKVECWAWTNTRADGTHYTHDDCKDWSSDATSDYGNVGDPKTKVSPGWSVWNTVNCARTGIIYCFEQP